MALARKTTLILKHHLPRRLGKKVLGEERGIVEKTQGKIPRSFQNMCYYPGAHKARAIKTSIKKRSQCFALDFSDESSIVSKKHEAVWASAIQAFLHATKVDWDVGRSVPDVLDETRQSPSSLVTCIVEIDAPVPDLSEKVIDIYGRQRKMEVIEIIKNIIRSRDPDEFDPLKSTLDNCLNGHDQTLVSIINDPEELIGARAMAARLYIAKVASLHKDVNIHWLVESIAHHDSVLIRLGALIGYADAGKYDLVQEYLTDQHPAVITEVLHNRINKK